MGGRIIPSDFVDKRNGSHYNYSRSGTFFERKETMTRGFITIATGKEMYYQLAKNLLLSYKLFCDSPYPFAIMCDRENEYTALFDDVVILENPLNAFWDKFELLTRSPYDETIFIDADCLAYADLNAYWDYFATAEDFTGCGTNYPIDSDLGLFQKDELGVYTGRAHWKPDICGGLYFIRRGEKCSALYQECKYISEHYDDFKWPDFCAPHADETVLCLAMAVHGIHAMDADPANYGHPWEATEMEHDIFTGKCSYATEWHPKVAQGRLVHFGTRYCSKPPYLFEVEKMNLLIKNNLRPSKSGVSLNFKDTLLYNWKLRYYWFCLKDFSVRAVNKLKRILGLAK